jgi:hypothetical protein
MKPCNITSRSLISARLSESNIKLQPRFKVWYISYLHALFHSSYLLFTFYYICHKKIKGKECIHVTIFKKKEKNKHTLPILTTDDKQYPAIRYSLTVLI